MQTREQQNYWDHAYRIFSDAAGTAYLKGKLRHHSGKGSDPIEWPPGKIHAACEQAQIDIYRKENAKKRGGDDVTLSLEDKIPGTDDLRVLDIVSTDLSLSDTSFGFGNPEAIVSAIESFADILKSPLALCHRGCITQERAAELLGVSQSTVSRRVRAFA